MINVLEIQDLEVRYHTPRGPLRAVDGVSLNVAEGEILGLVGESGCGKSSLARCVMGLTQPSEGHLSVAGRDGTEFSRHQRAQAVQMVFQDPVNSLNPRQTIGQTLEQAFGLAGVSSAQERARQSDALALRVGLNQGHLARYPHELSGGQCQRAGIARALALEPRLIVCDEPVSALDVSVQAQVLNLFLTLQADLGLSYLFISHDLSVVRFVSHRIAVMYLGRIVEIGPAETLWNGHLHPYTRALLPVSDQTAAGEEPFRLQGDVPSPLNPPSGCSFRTRCPFAQPLCSAERPGLRSLDGSAHLVACHFAENMRDVAGHARVLSSSSPNRSAS